MAWGTVLQRLGGVALPMIGLTDGPCGAPLDINWSLKRRKGVALRLVTTVEEWMVRNGAEYAFLATEKNNDASKNLFTIKCNYVNLSSLVIFVQPTSSLTKQISRDIKIEKVDIDLAISLYRRTMRTKDLYPLDMDVILKEKLSLAIWTFWVSLHIWDLWRGREPWRAHGIHVEIHIKSGRRVWGYPLANHVPQTDSMSCIDDLWYTKRLPSHGDENIDELMMKGQVRNVFVDPRDF
ncbi:putative N-acetyltransferase HLS1-like [Glycine max]|nr:putative N-acetyltransferase HLS1-like [Glycine max]